MSLCWSCYCSITILLRRAPLPQPRCVCPFAFACIIAGSNTIPLFRILIVVPRGPLTDAHQPTSATRVPSRSSWYIFADAQDELCGVDLICIDMRLIPQRDLPCYSLPASILPTCLKIRHLISESLAVCQSTRISNDTYLNDQGAKDSVPTEINSAFDP